LTVITLFHNFSNSIFPHFQCPLCQILKTYFTQKSWQSLPFQPKMYLKDFQILKNPVVTLYSWDLNLKIPERKDNKVSEREEGREHCISTCHSTKAFIPNNWHTWKLPSLAKITVRIHTYVRRCLLAATPCILHTSESGINPVWQKNNPCF